MKSCRDLKENAEFQSSAMRNSLLLTNPKITLSLMRNKVLKPECT